MTKGTRREFLKTTAAAALAGGTSGATGQSISPALPKRTDAQGIDLLRQPDFVNARFGSKDVVKMLSSDHAWTCPGLRVLTEPGQAGRRRELPIRVRNDGKDLTYLHLRWLGRQSETLLSIGDQWERSYGDLAWRGTIPERVMPWYFLTFDGARLNGYGVMTQPSAFCFWQRDDEGITLSVDLRNGGDSTELGGRELHACTVVTRMGLTGESIWQAGQEFCQLMCQAPRLPKEPLFGSNDWNYAYGKNTAASILRDADLIASLAPAGSVRPHVVIDDGWQNPERFPSMPDLAARLRERNVRPGLWIRPLRAAATTPASLLLPDLRFGKNAAHDNLAFDPTNPEALKQVLQTVTDAVQWGYDFIKHDFSTYELFGRWGSDMHGEVTRPGWHFQDRSRTNAEITRDLYLAIRNAAGDQTTILGCNTIGHVAAGIFESQRIGDDTSGNDWERTRRFGVNSLSQRIAQHRTFFYVDPDCVAITPRVTWRETSQWMDVVGRSGTSLFFSPEPSSITPEVKSAMKDAMAVAAQQASGAPVHPTTGTTPAEWHFTHPSPTQKRYDWVPPEGVSPFSV